MASKPTSLRTARSDRAIREDLVVANRVLAGQAVLDAFGHVSARSGRNPNRFWLSRSLAPALVGLDDLLEHGLDGEAIDEREHLLYAERFLHARIYRARPDVGAIVHCHAPSLVAFANSSIPLRPVTHLGSFIVGGVAVFDGRSGPESVEVLIHNEGLGDAVARALGEAPALLLLGHGAVVVGRSLPDAVGRSVYLDLNARIQAQAIALGGSVAVLGRPDVPAGSFRTGDDSGSYARAWELWKSTVGEDTPRRTKTNRPARFRAGLLWMRRTRT
jgi:HCOMODA/2-hydroxy-3-carboxy-muconic semialdehyde decarboxylase